MGGPKRCNFCQIASGALTPLPQIYYQDDRIVIFKDKTEGPAVYIQTIPKTHEPWNCRFLDNEHVPLLVHMYRQANTVMDQLLHTGERRFGFHITPMNSVDHLHMHGFGFPCTPPHRAWRVSAWFPGFRTISDQLLLMGEDPAVLDAGTGVQQPAASAQPDSEGMQL